MNTAIIVMLVILGVALAVIAVAAVGMQGGGSDRTEIGRTITRTAQHLNGDAQPPRGLVEFFDEIPLPRSADSASDRQRSGS
ncbi:MAG TPA: hypothetical protein PLE12_07970 [Propionicimonas sp.]|nr:hypothetical protein [Propionicimonas sp.]